MAACIGLKYKHMLTMQVFFENSKEEELMNKRKELTFAYMQTPRPMGVYHITNNVNGRMLIGASPNLDGRLNRLQFELKMGMHRNKELQRDWNEYGEHAFTLRLQSLRDLQLQITRTPRVVVRCLHRDVLSRGAGPVAVGNLRDRDDSRIRYLAVQTDPAGDLGDSCRRGDRRVGNA